MRKVPAILHEVCGIDLTQGALTQEALKLGNEQGRISQEANKVKLLITEADYVNTHI